MEYIESVSTDRQLPNYRQISNINTKGALVGNKTVDHSDVVRA